MHSEVEELPVVSKHEESFVQLSLRKELQLVVEVGVGPEWHLKPEGDVI
jgi:hypothetical protein